ncbi:MAG: radical SAM protein [Methanosarcinales archaeon]|nr:MAG: radical SAM protein [Methanosarcinales archaeon]
MELSIYKGLGFEILFDVNGRSAQMVVKGPLSRFVMHIAEGFNAHAALEKVAAVREGQVIISNFMPPAPSGPFNRLVENQIKRLLLRKSMPESLMLLTTGRCQCKCKHCIVHGMKKEPHIPTKELYHVIDQALELGAYHVSFEGGEPTLRDDIFDLIKHVDKSKASTHLITNGLRLTRDYVQRLKNAGLVYLHVSLDSPYPKEHDMFRGVEGVFEKASAGVKYGVEEGLIGIVEYTATPYNSDLKRLEDLYKHCSSLGVHEILIDEVVPGGRWEYHDDNLLTKEDYERLAAFQNEANKRRDGPRVSSSYSYRDPNIMGCFAGRRWVWISPTGEIMPCLHIPLSFGNVRDISLESAWKKIRRHPLFKKKPETCAWRDPQYRDNYFGCIRNAIEEERLPYRVEE